MPFTLSLMFDGLCAFVPSADHDRMTVLLVNAIDGSCSSMSGEHGQSHYTPAHYPYISFNRENLQGDDPNIVVNGIDGVAGIRFFDWEELVLIGVDPTEGGLNIRGGRRPGSAEPLDENDLHDFSWLADLQKIDPDIGEVDPACLRPDPPRNQVLGRLTLDRGSIYTPDVAKVPSGYLLWEFKTIEGDFVSDLCQALAERMQWDGYVKGDYVTLRFAKFSGATPQNLRFSPTDGSDNLVIRVRNLPLDEALGLGVSSHDSSLHFPLLARVAKGRPDKKYIPSIVNRPGEAKVEPVRGGTTICIGGTLSGG